MQRKMRDLVRHYDGLGPSPLVLFIAGNASIGAFGLLSAYANWFYRHYDLQDCAVLITACSFCCSQVGLRLVTLTTFPFLMQ